MVIGGACKVFNTLSRPETDGADLQPSIPSDFVNLPQARSRVQATIS